MLKAIIERQKRQPIGEVDTAGQLSPSAQTPVPRTFVRKVSNENK